MSAREEALALLRERVWSNIVVVENCWHWTGSISPTGYGRIHVRGLGVRLAHRLSYEMAKGPIPEGLVIDHLCRNRDCVNPEHLEAVTMRENTLRGDTAPARNVTKTHCRRGHDYSVQGYVHKGKRYCRACAVARSLARVAASQEARRARV